MYSGSQRSGKDISVYYITKNGPVGAFFDFLLELLFPMGTYCVCCGKYIDLSRSYLICDNCIKEINWGRIRLNLEKERRHTAKTENLDSVLSCMVYGMFARRMIFDFKYNGRSYLVSPLSMILSDRLMSEEASRDMLLSINYICAVPMHNKKEKLRGYNHASLLAKKLTLRLLNYELGETDSFGYDFSYLADCLIRTRATAAQRSITGAERSANLDGAFALNPKYASLMAGSRVLLVDDIYTTGATAAECARVLKENGALEVHFISLATGNDYLEIL